MVRLLFAACLYYLPVLWIYCRISILQMCWLRPSRNLQGVRTKTVKKSARVLIEKYYSRLTLDFHVNKKLVGEVAIIPSKRMRNKIAGFVTHLMKRIQRGPVRGISLKLQEEERERRLDFVPEVSRRFVIVSVALIDVTYRRLCFELLLHAHTYSLCLCPQKSAIEKDIITIDEDTKNMLEAMGFKDLPGTQIAAAGRA